MKPEVKIYSLSTCSHCKATKKFLDDVDVFVDAFGVVFRHHAPIFVLIAVRAC